MSEPKINFELNLNLNLKQEEINQINARLDTIKNIEITHLFKPISKILEKGIEQKIENHEYDLLIGEDASGRIPALVFDQIFKKVYGEENPKLLFMAGARYKYGNSKISREFTEYVKMNASGKKKALIVTDFVETGGSISAICNALKNNDIEYDIASCAIYNEKEFEYTPEVKDHIYFGSFGKPEIFHQPNLSGVLKNYGDVLSSHANQHVSDIKLPENVLGEKTIYSQDKINEAREDVKKLAEILVETNFKNKNG